MAWWRRVVREWSTGEKSASAVAKTHGVTAASLYRWRKRLASETFVEITPVDRAEPASCLEVHWGGRARLLIPAGLSSEQLQAVLGAAARV